MNRRELLSLGVLALLPQIRTSAQAPPADLLGDLVAANHILATEGIVDGYGHISVRSPGNTARFFLARSIAPESVVAADILEYGLDGEAIDPRGKTSYKERFIHSEIYRARRPDADVSVAVHDAFRREDVIRGDEIGEKIGRRRLRARANLRQQRQHAQRQEIAPQHLAAGPAEAGHYRYSGFMNVPSAARAMSMTATIASRFSGP